MSQAFQEQEPAQTRVAVSREQLSEAFKEDIDQTIPQALPIMHSPHRIAPQIFLDTVEHVALGDNLELKLPNPNAKPGDDPYIYWRTGDPENTFNLKELDSTLNDQNLSYGQINGLAGDFYGTYYPISGDVSEKPLSDAERTQRFLDAWHLLAGEPESVAETNKILKDENEFETTPYTEWKKYVKEHNLQPSWIFAKKMGDAFAETEAWTNATFNRIYNGISYPSYLKLLVINFDHFGKDAHLAYSVGHTAALNHAITAGKAQDLKQLKVAYAMNAFADHFLEDSFSAGHIRTPRRDLHGGEEFKLWNSTYTMPAKDLCSNLMHDEDNALGIKVRNNRKDPKPDEWTCYGDAYIHDDVSKPNKAICLEALKASVDDVWDAYHTRTMPTHFSALDLVPDIDDALERKDGPVAPLFKVVNGVIKERNWTAWHLVGGFPPKFEYELNRTNWDDSNYFDLNSPLKDWFQLYYRSGWWNYPLLPNGASPS